MNEERTYTTIPKAQISVSIVGIASSESERSSGAIHRSVPPVLFEVVKDIDALEETTYESPKSARRGSPDFEIRTLAFTRLIVSMRIPQMGAITNTFEISMYDAFVVQVK